MRRRRRAGVCLAYEDLRHQLKHKRRYAPAALTAKERKVLARKSAFTRVWMATGKMVYVATTRGLFNFTDREGGGKRLVNDAPGAGRAHQDKTGGARRSDRRLCRPKSLRSTLANAGAPQQHIQVARQCPAMRQARCGGKSCSWSQMNRADLVEPLIREPAERTLVQAICDERKNLRDRFNFA